jgi:glycosyltransferase involved in cell wall biosynthesis
MLRNMSFIVIARNESFAVNRCLASIACMPLDNCEVICVDSASTDNTQEVMKNYVDRIDNMRIIECSGFVNAAVARNAGMELATKEYIYFVDGDIELCPEFIFEAVDRIKKGKANAVTGGLDEIVYADGYDTIISKKSHRRHYLGERKIYDSGGTFVVSREIAHRVGLWDPQMVRCQDFDYFLRISRHGETLAIPSVMGIHHTLSYCQRPWQHFIRGYPMYMGKIVRKNLDQPLRLKGCLRNYRIGFAWWGAILLSILLFLLFPRPIVLVWGGLCVFTLLDLLWGLINKKNIVHRLFAHYIDLPLVFVGIFVVPRKQQQQSTTVNRII